MEQVITTPSNQQNEKHKCYQQFRQNKEESLKKEIQDAGLNNQVEFIQSKGDFKLKDIYYTLILKESNVEATLLYLEAKAEKRRKSKEQKSEKIKLLEEEMKNLGLNTAYEQLKGKLPNLKIKKALKALKEAGNVDKAYEILTDKTARLKKKEVKYFTVFPNDTQIEWSKYKEAKKLLNQKRKEEKYFKIFPNDKQVDLDKYKKFKSEQKLEKAKAADERERYLLKEMKAFKNIYLDGNNMLMIDSTLRGLCIKKNFKVACEKTAELSFTYAKLSKQNIILIFDTEKNCYEKDSDGVKFKVCSARPNFETSDDALVDWVGGFSASDLADSLFVTSDRELLTRLIKKGATNVMKSGTWWKIMKETIGDELYNSMVSKKD